MASETYTVVVADDEQELREAVCSMIRWEEIGFRLVGRRLVFAWSEAPETDWMRCSWWNSCSRICF